jgi:hypothetical protein
MLTGSFGVCAASGESWQVARQERRASSKGQEGCECWGLDTLCWLYSRTEAAENPQGSKQKSTKDKSKASKKKANGDAANAQGALSRSANLVA